MLAQDLERDREVSPLDEDALSKAFLGLAAVLVKGGLRSKVCEKYLRSAMAIAAKNALLSEGKEPTNQNISIRTGIDRRYVQESLATDSRDLFLSPFGLVLNRWQTDPAYSTNRVARRLVLHGDSPSFESLCRSYASNIRWRTVLSFLEEAGCVERDGGYITLVRSNPYGGDDALLLQMAMSSFSMLGDTLGHNVTESDKSKRYFQRYLFSRDVGHRHISQFREMCSNQLSSTFEEISKRMDEFERTKTSEGSDNNAIAGVMLTYFQSDGEGK